MVKVIMIRHGEPDYSYFTGPFYEGYGMELGQLTQKGIEQAKAVSVDLRLDGAELIVSSPFPRALHTAMLISRKRDLDVEIQPGLHEWIPDNPYRFTEDADYEQPNVEFVKYHGERHEDSTYHYESLQEVFDRAYKALLPYVNHQKIIVVCHAVLMRAFAYELDIPHCGIIEFEFDENRTLADNGRN